MKYYAVRIDVLDVTLTDEQKRDIKDWLGSRTDITLEKIVVRDGLVRGRLTVNAGTELAAVRNGTDTFLGALLAVSAYIGKIPSVHAFSQAVT